MNHPLRLESHGGDGRGPCLLALHPVPPPLSSTRLVLETPSPSVGLHTVNSKYGLTGLGFVSTVLLGF